MCIVNWTDLGQEQNILSNMIMNDKTKHVICGAVIGLLSLPLSLFTGLWWAYLIVAGFATFIFVGKEIYDVYKPYPTGFDKMDLEADYIGLIVGFIISFLIFNIIGIIGL